MSLKERRRVLIISLIVSILLIVGMVGIVTQKGEVKAGVIGECKNCEGGYLTDNFTMKDDGTYYHHVECTNSHSLDNYCDIYENHVNVVRSVVKVATCYEDGQVRLTCNDCERTELKTEEALGHNLGNWEEFTSEQHIKKCKRTGCDYSVLENHNPSGWRQDGANGHYKMCNSCYVTVTSDVHHYDSSNTCTVCGYSSSGGGGTSCLHESCTYTSNGSSGHTKTCSCGYTETEEHWFSSNKCIYCNYDRSTTQSFSSCYTVCSTCNSTGLCPGSMATGEITMIQEETITCTGCTGHNVIKRTWKCSLCNFTNVVYSCNTTEECSCTESIHSGGTNEHSSKECPTCTGNGYTSVSHSWQIERKNATCTSAGYIVQICSRSDCREVNSFSVINPTGHTAGAAATCTTPQTCTVCGYQIAPATGHTAGAAATCTTPQTCTICGDQIAPATGHSYDIKNDATHHWEECTKCGEEKVNSKKEHTVTTWTDNGNGSHSGTCTVCNYNLTKQHNFVNEECNDCGARKSIQQECTHKYETKKNSTHHWEECTKCGEEKTNSKEIHKVTKWTSTGTTGHMGSCDECKYAMEEKHTNGSTADCRKCDYRSAGTGNNGNGNDGINNDGNTNDNSGGSNSDGDNNQNNNGNVIGNGSTDSNGQNSSSTTLDGTQSGSSIPNTGENSIIIVGSIVALIGFGVFALIKLKGYKEI